MFKDIEVLYSTSFTATGISMLQMYSQTAVQLPLARSLRCCCSKPEHSNGQISRHCLRLLLYAVTDAAQKAHTLLAEGTQHML